jgi:hypothetical protein
MGLTNGASGIIRDIIYPLDRTPDSLPSALLIEFIDYIGPKFFSNESLRKNWIPISPFSAYSQVLNSTRKQVPIRLAYAMTIHKSQGQTLDMAVIDLGSKETQLGLTYVALSRLRHINNLLIQPFTFERLEKIKKSESLPPRIHEEKRLKLLAEQLKSKYNRI